MTAAEKEKAMSLQKEFRTKMCPICLEPFDLTPDKDAELVGDATDKEKTSERQNRKLKRVDSFGLPLVGTDDQPIKLLRCGHIFDLTCWQMWVDSGQGNPWICPVCRQDVGRPKRRPAAPTSDAAAGGDRDRLGENEELANREESSLFARMIANTSGPSMLLRPVTNQTQTYGSVQPRPRRAGSTPFAPLSHPTFRRLHPMFGISAAPPAPGLGEQTPLFARDSSSNGEDDDY